MPGWGLLNYNAPAAVAGATNTDFAAATDADFSQRNGHYIFSEPYYLFAASMNGVRVTRGRIQCPTWNAIGEFVLMAANRAITPPSNAQYDLFQAYQPPIPMNEEFQVQVSNDLGAATEVENVPIIVATPDWNANLPRGRMLIPVRCTMAVTPTLNAWSGPQALTFSQGLRGGVYAVVGAVCQGANAVAFRIIFPRYHLYRGRKLRPGWLVQTVQADVIQAQIQPWVLGMGEWGRFHTFEPPQIEVFGTVAGAITYQIFLWLVYLGEDLSGLGAGLGGGY